MSSPTRREWSRYFRVTRWPWGYGSGFEVGYFRAATPEHALALAQKAWPAIESGTTWRVCAASPFVALALRAGRLLRIR